MGSANSTIPAEPLIAAVAVVGVLGYGYAHYLQPARPGGSTDTDASFLGLSKGGSTVLHGQKKRGRKLHLPGDATLKNLDFLDSSVPPATTTTTTPPVKPQAAPRSQGNGGGGDIVPGGFASADNNDAHRSPQQQHQPEQDVKKPKKKRGKKIASDLAPADAGGAAPGKTEKMQVSGPPPPAAVADASDERWTRVEARKKKAVPPQGELSKLQTSMDATTSDAGITTSVTGNSSPVTERTTEDELPSGLDECVFFCILLNAVSLNVCGRSAQGVSLLVAPSRVRPPPGEQPVKGFQWDDYEGVQVDGDASSEDDGGWGVVRSRKRGSFILSAVKSVSRITPHLGPTKTDSGSTIAAPQPQPQSKKQRQNAQKREAQKEAKRERDAQQQAALSSHKRELESARRVDQAGTSSKRTGSRYDSLHLP